MDAIPCVFGVSRERVPIGVHAVIREDSVGTVEVPVVHGDRSWSLGEMGMADFVSLCGRYRKAISTPSPSVAMGTGMLLAEMVLREAGWRGRGTQAVRLLRLVNRPPLEAANLLVETHRLGEDAGVDTWRMPYAEGVAQALAQGKTPAEIARWLRQQGRAFRGYGGVQGGRMVADAIVNPPRRVVVDLDQQTVEATVAPEERDQALREAIRLIERELSR